MEEIFAVIGKLYFDLLRANNIIDTLRTQQEELNTSPTSNNNA